jgi:SnoaL-like domain
VSLDLPTPIAIYIAAENRGDAEALGQCFAEHAVVRDEGQTIEGLAAIKQWKTETRRKYQHTVEPLAFAQQDDTSIVTSRLTGNFPGSPIELRFIFKLEGDMKSRRSRSGLESLPYRNSGLNAPWRRYRQTT